MSFSHLNDETKISEFSNLHVQTILKELVDNFNALIKKAFKGEL